jgi:hypothetical protein
VESSGSPVAVSIASAATSPSLRPSPRPPAARARARARLRDVVCAALHTAPACKAPPAAFAAFRWAAQR